MSGGGKVTLRAYRPSQETCNAEGLPERGYVVFEVRNRGQEIAPETLGRIFNPLFSTKENGQGSGLGLSMVQAFSARSGGHVSCLSILGQGTTVRIFLPLADKTTEGQHAVKTSSPVPQLSAPPRVLVVDDEANLIGLAARYLRAKGCDVDCAEAVSETRRALEVQSYDVVVTDMFMPDGTGLELAQGMKRRQIPSRIILVSGNVDVTGFSADDIALFQAVLEKPYGMSILYDLIQESILQRSAWIPRIGGGKPTLAS
ncbi:MAG: ATP-binding protein [Pelagimonas sp.]|jgi:CheY-like chemotaxis protein|nr:ATP-binding protein [Pelagimonas sp.]